MNIMVFDMSGILYKTYYGNPNIKNDSKGPRLALHSAFITMNHFYKTFHPDKVIAAFDRGKSWRYAYTMSEECISQKPYKGHRRKNMTRSEQEKYHNFLEHINELRDILQEHTTIMCLSAEHLEADDLVGGVTEAFDKDNITIISRDTDYLQLVNDQVSLFDPQTKKMKTLKEWDNDPEWFMFVKCIRGDTSDNVQSALPGVRLTRLKDVYSDSFKRTNLMNEEWVMHNDPENHKIVKVEDLFNEGKLLMDLKAQPKKIRNRIFKTIINEMDRTKEFNWVKFVQFLAKNDLKNISDNLSNYMKLLSS